MRVMLVRAFAMATHHGQCPSGRRQNIFESLTSLVACYSPDSD